MALPANLTTSFMDLFIGGVDWNRYEFGGEECLNSVTLWRRLAETVAACAVGSVLTAHGARQICAEGSAHVKPGAEMRGDGAFVARPGRLLFLAALSLVFGMEICYKFVTYQLVYLLFPCHVVSVAWIYLLATPPTTFNVCVYRVCLHLTHGTLLAILLPVDDSLVQPFESEV